MLTIASEKHNRVGSREPVVLLLSFSPLLLEEYLEEMLPEL